MKFKPMFGEYQFLYILIVIDIGPFDQFHKNLILVLILTIIYRLYSKENNGDFFSSLGCVKSCECVSCDLVHAPF
jgi:hypothetical protein